MSLVRKKRFIELLITKYSITRYELIAKSGVFSITDLKCEMTFTLDWNCQQN